MDIQQIQYFLALAKELHFWNTAAKMNITQSALSRQIQSLENELGLQLFYRNKRNVKLTPAGEFLLEKWGAELQQLHSYHQVARQIHLGEHGTIRIAHPDSISSSILPDVVGKITHAFPKLQIELIQLPYESQDDYLKNYRIDLAFTRDITSSATIDSKKIHTEDLCLVVPEDHQFKTVADISAENLAGQKFLLTAGHSGSSYEELIERIFKSYGISPESYIRCEFGSTIVSLIRRDLGISILPQSYELHLSKGVRYIPMPFKTDLFINWRKDDPNPVVLNILNLI